MAHGNIAFFVPHVGCPRQCSFCDQHAITGGAQVPLPREVEEVCRRAAGQLGDRVRETRIAFFGGSFTAIPRKLMVSLLEPAFKAVKEFCFAGIRCSTRPDAVDGEILDLLEQYGVDAVELGAQSMDDEVLRKNRRGHTAAQTAEAAGWIKARGMELGLQMMTGLYGDTDETALQTAKRLIALEPDTARVYPTVVLRETCLAELYRRGEYRPQTLEQAVALCARLLSRFEEAGVQVIRMGLHAERQVEQRMLAGPYHPAFRELVESRRFLDRLIEQLKSPGEYRVSVNPRDISAALGQGRENLRKLGELGFKVEFRQEAAVPRGEFQVV